MGIFTGIEKVRKVIQGEPTGAAEAAPKEDSFGRIFREERDKERFARRYPKMNPLQRYQAREAQKEDIQLRQEEIAEEKEVFKRKLEGQTPKRTLNLIQEQETKQADRDKWKKEFEQAEEKKKYESLMKAQHTYGEYRMPTAKKGKGKKGQNIYETPLYGTSISTGRSKGKKSAGRKGYSWNISSMGLGGKSQSPRQSQHAPSQGFSNQGFSGAEMKPWSHTVLGSPMGSSGKTRKTSFERKEEGIIKNKGKKQRPLWSMGNNKF